MIRARKLSLVHVKRTLLPLYGHTQATPHAAFLDASLVTGADANVAVFPGMVATSTSGEQVKLHDTSTERPFGLFANFVNGDLDELGDNTEVGIWRGGPDAVFEATGDAIDPAVSWTGTATGTLIFGRVADSGASKRGQLTLVANAGTTPYPVGRLIEAPSNSKIVFSLLTEVPRDIDSGLEAD